MDDTTIYIAPVDSACTIVIDGPENIGTVIIGEDKIAVVFAEPEIVVVDPLASDTPGAIILAPDEIGSVVIEDNPITVLISNPKITVIGDGIPGPQGPPGDGGAETAIEVSYSGVYPTVQAALDALLYVAPQITGFTNSVGTIEIGATVTAVTLSWSLNKTMTSLSLDNSLGSVLGLTSKALADLTLTSDATYTLTVGDGQNTTSAETTIAFRNKRYWGVSASASLSNSGVLALSSEFATDYDKSITYDATGGKYLYYAFPALFGTPSHVTVGGLSFSDFSVSTLSFTNASGYSEPYSVIWFNNRQTGAAIAVVWA